MELNCRKLGRLQSVVQEHMGQLLLVGSCWLTLRYIGLATIGNSSVFAQLFSRCDLINSCLKLSYWAHCPRSVSLRKPLSSLDVTCCLSMREAIRLIYC